MRALRLDSLNVDQLRELDDLYRTTRDVRVRTRAQMILLVAEQGLAVSEVAAIVRESGETARRGVPRDTTTGETARWSSSMSPAWRYCRTVETPPPILMSRPAAADLARSRAASIPSVTKLKAGRAPR